MAFKAWLAAIAILLLELSEKFAYYAILKSLYFYLNYMLAFDYDVTVWISIFIDLLYILPIFSGYLADSFIGRFHAIWGSLVFYAVGAILLGLSSLTISRIIPVDNELTAARSMYLVGLSLFALGATGLKSSVSQFGAQQAESLGPTAVGRFYNWYYWVQILASGAALFILSYSYLIFSIAVAVALIIFLIPTKIYKKDQSKAEFFRIIGHAIHQKRVAKKDNISWIDHARTRNGGRYSDDRVNEIIGFGRVVPIIATFIIYRIIFTQITFSLSLQPFTMKWPNEFKNEGTQSHITNLFIHCFVVVAIPIMDLVVYPLIRKCSGKEIPRLKRIGFGMVLAVGSLVLAGIIEMVRKHDINLQSMLNMGNSTESIESSLPIFYLIPQHVIFRLSEVLVCITGLEFVYAESPISMKGIAMGLYVATAVLGSWLSTALVAVVNVVTSKISTSWIQGNINKGHLDYFFFLLACLMTANVVLFICLSYWYNRKKEVATEVVKTDTGPSVNSAFKDE